MRPILAFLTAVLLSTALPAGLAATDDATYAVVDRLTDDHAVLLLEEGIGTAEQRVLDPAQLDAEGRYEGAVHRVIDGRYVYDGAETARRRRSASDRFDRLTRSS